MEIVVSHITDLGFVLNLEKSSLLPSQQTTFLGVQLDSTRLRARLSDERIETSLSCLSTVQDRSLIPQRTCMRVAGFIASTIHLVRLGRFLVRLGRPFLKWMHSLRILSSDGDLLVREAWAPKPWMLDQSAARCWTTEPRDRFPMSEGNPRSQWLDPWGHLYHRGC